MQGFKRKQKQRRQRALPTADSWHRGHVAPSCAIWQQLGDHLVIMPSAGRQQSQCFADYWQTAKRVTW